MFGLSKSERLEKTRAKIEALTQKISQLESSKEKNGGEERHRLDQLENLKRIRNELRAKEQLLMVKMKSLAA
jgi:BMFP domain-containing protein YqiC